MKDKIIEIFEKHAEYTGVAHEILDGVLFDKVADEILELYRIGMNCEECDWREVFEQERLSDSCKHSTFQPRGDYNYCLECDKKWKAGELNIKPARPDLYKSHQPTHDIRFGGSSEEIGLKPGCNDENCLEHGYQDDSDWIGSTGDEVV